MAINILQELNLGAAKASFSRDEVETLADIKKLDVAQKYPNNYDIFCKEDGCKYRLNKTSHSTMQDNLPHPTGKWRRVDSVISSSIPAPITVGDVVLYLGPTVMDQVDHSKVKFQTGKYYRTEYTKVNKQMYAFVQNTAPDVPDTSPNPAVIWFSETSTLSEGSVLFTPVNGSIFDNKEHGIIMTSDWDGQSAISGSSYEYLDNSNNAKLGMVRNSNFDITFDSFPELTWNMFDTEAELENIKQNVIPEAISSATEEIKTEVKEEVKEDVNANLGQAKKLNDILTDEDIKLIKQGGLEKLVSSKPNGTITDTTIGLVQCDYTINQETTEVTLNITDIAYGPFASTEEVLSRKFVDETSQLMPMEYEQYDMSIFAISCRVTNKTRSEILSPLLNSNLYNGTIDLPNLMDNLYRSQEIPIIIGYAVNAPTSDNDTCPAADANEYTLVYRLFTDPSGNPESFATPVPVPVEELPYIKDRTETQLGKNTVLNLVIFVLCQNSVISNFVSSEEKILKVLNEQIVIGSKASGVLNEFPTIKSEINDSVLEQFAQVKKLNDVMTDADVATILSHPREPFLIPAAPSFFSIDDDRVIGTVFVKYTKDENGVLTITEASAVSSITDLPGGYMEWISDGNLGVLYIIAQRGSAAFYKYNNTILSATLDVVYGNSLENSKLTVNSIYLNAQKSNWSGTNFDPRTANYINIDYTHGNSGSYALKDLKCDWKDGAPVTLQEVYDSAGSNDYYVISCMVEINPTVASPQDVTHKAITKDIIRRIFVGYEKTGLVAEFPTLKEEVTSVTQLAEKIDNRIPEKTGDFIKNSIVDFKKITPLSIPSSSSYSQDKVKFDGFVSLGVNTYDPTDASRSIAPVFKNYFDDTQSDYVTSDNLLTDAPTSWVSGQGWSRYVGIMGSIFSTTYNNMGKSAFENALRSTYCEYDPSKSHNVLFNSINTYFEVVDVYVKYYSYNDIDHISTTGWIRIEPGANIWDLISGSSFYTGYVQVCIVVDGYFGDCPFDNAGPFIKNVDAILNLVSFTDKILNINKISDILSINGIDTAVDATKSIIQKYPIKIATSSDSGFNGALKINADTYDPETTTSVSLSFYNYYDSSKSNYRNPANPATPMLVEDKFVAVPAFIDIAEVLGVPSFTSASQLKEYCKNISVRFDRNQSIKVDLQNNNNTNVYSGANVFIRDIYFRTYSTAQAPAQAATYNTKITNSDPIADLIDASSSTGFIPIFIFILEVIPDANYSVPLKNYLAQQNFAKFINSLCEISFNKVRDAEDKANKVQEAIENIPSIADDISALESKVAKCSKLTDRFTDAEMDKLFKKITEKIISSVNGVNDVDFRICACTSSDNWETATITKYMEAPLSGDLTDYHISLPGAYGDTFDTIAVSCGISFTNGNSATGLPYYEVINNKAINTWLNAYLLDPVAIYTAQTSSSSSFDKSTYYKTRVKDGGPSDSTIKYSDMEPLKSNAYEWSSRIHFLVFIQVNSNTTAEDLNAADLFELAKKAIVPVGTTSGIVSEFDTVKQNANSAKDMADEFETVKQNANSAIELAIPKETKDYIKNKLHDIRAVSLREATSSASQGIAYDITNCNGLISIGSSYDDQDESRSISVTFKNYFDSSKSDYVSASEVIAIKDAAEWYQRTNYIAIPVVIGDRCGDKESILEQLKGVFATKSSSAYLIKKKTSYGARPYGKLVDVYGGITSDSSGSAKLNQLSFSSLSRTDESTFSVAELLSDAVIGSDYYQTPCLILVYDVYYSDSPEISSDTIIELDTEDLVKNTFNMYAIPIENRVNQLEQKFDGIETAVSSISSVTDSVDNISDSMSDYMSAKWLPTPIAFPDEALENEQEPSGNSKNYDFLLYPTFVDVPHSTGSSVEGKKSRYSVKPIPESGENTTVKALYESEDSMYLLFGFFGEKLLPESLGGDYTIPETYNENTIESFNRVSKTLWYSDIYLNMQNTFSYSMIKGIRDSLLEIDVSNIFLNFNPRVIKSLYAKVTADPGNELTYSTYTNRGLNNMEDFVKIPYANIQDINTISMEDIVNMCGRPDKTKSSGSSKAVVLFIAEINKSSFPGLASLITPAYGVSNTTSDILAIYQAMFANNSESSPIYMARSINDSLKKTKEVAVEAARYAAATLTAAKHYDTLSDLKRLISEGESGYIVRNGETEGTSVADVYIKTTEGALIKIASGVEYEAPIS